MGAIVLGPSNGCWVDLFDAPATRGAPLRLHGPADFPGLRISRGPARQELQSLRTGPWAYVQLFALGRFDESVIWLVPNQTVDVSELTTRDELNSLRLYDRPPFASEPGYAAYMLWAASQVGTATGSGG